MMKQFKVPRMILLTIMAISLLFSCKGKSTEKENVVSDSEKNLSVQPETGAWQLGTYVDEFGEDTSEKYLLLEGEGTFSNSATTDSELTALLFADKEGFSFRLIEYGSHVVKSGDHYTFRIKCAATGEVYEMGLSNDVPTGYMSGMNEEDKQKMEEFLSLDGVLTVYVEDMYSSTYLFKLDVTGYTKAKELL